MLAASAWRCGRRIPWARKRRPSGLPAVCPARRADRGKILPWVFRATRSSLWGRSSRARRGVRREIVIRRRLGLDPWIRLLHVVWASAKQIFAKQAASSRANLRLYASRAGLYFRRHWHRGARAHRVLTLPILLADVFF